METAAPPAPTEHGWVKLIFGLAAFLVVPTLPWLSALFPLDQPFILLVTALAACGLAGWLTAGRPAFALVWMGLAAVVVVVDRGGAPDFLNLVRGWSLLVAGAFGFVCLVAPRQPFFPRALASLGVALVVAGILGVAGPVTLERANQAVESEFGRRSTAITDALTSFATDNPAWRDFTAKYAAGQDIPAEVKQELDQISAVGVAVFPALLMLESLAALGLAWATYHRLGRARLGPPLAALRDFRFSDHLVWGLIAGLIILVLPPLAPIQSLGTNLVVFFSALYAIRGFGVLAWFVAPRTVRIALAVGCAMLLAPFIAIFPFTIVGVTAVGLGLGDTWADWRTRMPSPT